jgi:hypothetical protein
MHYYKYFQCRIPPPCPSSSAINHSHIAYPSLPVLTRPCKWNPSMISYNYSKLWVAAVSIHHQLSSLQRKSTNRHQVSINHSYIALISVTSRPLISATIRLPLGAKFVRGSNLDVVQCGYHLCMVFLQPRSGLMGDPKIQVVVISTCE